VADGVVVVRLSGDCPVGADAVPAKVRAGVTGADADACSCWAAWLRACTRTGAPGLMRATE
jgi:hypothetical protein